MKELSNYLRVHPSTVYKLLKEGELPGFKLGSYWRFNLQTIERWCMGRSEEDDEVQPPVELLPESQN